MSRKYLKESPQGINPFRVVEKMHFRYLDKELYYRNGRTWTAILGLSSMAYREAARIPLKEIGAEITVQRNGDVPEELPGPVFPCSAVTIQKAEVGRIRALKWVQALARHFCCGSSILIGFQSSWELATGAILLPILIGGMTGGFLTRRIAPLLFGPLRGDDWLLPNRLWGPCLYSLSRKQASFVGHWPCNSWFRSNICSDTLNTG